MKSKKQIIKLGNVTKLTLGSPRGTMPEINRSGKMYWVG
jgi:hypothetical protein